MSEVNLQQRIDRMAGHWGHACGCVYEVYVDGFSREIDSAFPPPHPDHEAALQLAREHDYASPAEREAMHQRLQEDGSCRHGLDPDCCPAGCGDL